MSLLQQERDFMQIDQVGEITILRACGDEAEELAGFVADWMLQVALTVNGTLLVPAIYQIAPQAQMEKLASQEGVDRFEDTLGNAYIDADWLAEQCPVAAATIAGIKNNLNQAGYPCISGE